MSSDNSIDIYLHPLVEELKKLWINGVYMYNVHTDTTFRIHATLHESSVITLHTQCYQVGAQKDMFVLSG